MEGRRLQRRRQGKGSAPLRSITATPEEVSNDGDVSLEQHGVALAAVWSDVPLRFARYPCPAKHRAARAQPPLVGEKQAETAVELARCVTTQPHDRGRLN